MRYLRFGCLVAAVLVASTPMAGAVELVTIDPLRIQAPPAGQSQQSPPPASSPAAPQTNSPNQQGEQPTAAPPSRCNRSPRPVS